MQYSFPLQGLKTRRELLRISGAYMSRQLSVEPATYSRWETGKRRPYFDQVVTIASILGCTTDDLRREPSPDERLALLKRAAVRMDAKRLGIDPDEHEATQKLLDQWPTVEPAPVTPVERALTSTPAPKPIDHQAEALAKLAAEWSDDDAE